MRAIEIRSKTDVAGNLRIDFPVHKSNKNVRVIILLDEEEQAEEDEALWMKAVSKNPAFEYLNDDSENIYTVNDGEPLYD
jgi:hypothetical protein